MEIVIPIFISTIFLSLLQTILGSLLSRLKNRYEYLPEEINADITTEALYDFEFISVSPEDKVERFLRTNEGFEYVQYDNETQGNELETTNNVENQVNNNDSLYNVNYISTDPFFISRATIASTFESRVTSIKTRRTFPTHFPTLQTNKNKILDFFKTLTVSSYTTIPTRSKQPVNLKSKEEQNNKEASKNGSNVSNGTSTSENLTNITSTTQSLLTISTTGRKKKKPSSLHKPKQIKASCYYCGLDVGNLSTAYCYDVFGNSDNRLHRLRKHLKIKCFRGTSKPKQGNKYYSPNFIGGCYKRYLDVGSTYNERGCRKSPPETGISYASTRLAKLEILLDDIEDGCVASPHASLTPFSRPISLYVRYHVCVCSTRYCNHASNTNYLMFHFLLFLSLIIHNLK